MLSKLAFSPSFYWVMQVQLTTNWSMYRKYKIQVDMLDFKKRKRKKEKAADILDLIYKWCMKM